MKDINKHLPGVPEFSDGYWIVLAAFILNAVASGCGLYAFSLFVKSLEVEFAWSRGGIMLAFTFFYIIMGAASPFIGRWIDRYGASKGILIGSIVSCAGFICLSQMRDIWQLYASYAVIGFGIASIGTIPATTITARWFRKRRGLALGIASMGMGMGGFIIAPLVGGVLIPAVGWRYSYMILAAIILLICIPLALFITKLKQDNTGLDIQNSHQSSRNTKEPFQKKIPDLTARMAMVTPAFWLIIITFFIIGVSPTAAIQHQVTHLEDIGFPIVVAAMALGSVGLASAIGKLAFGWLCDRIMPKYACAIGLALQAFSIAILLTISRETSLIMIWIYAVTLGLGIGCWLPTMSVLTSSNFGLSSYGAIFGIVAMSNALGTAVGPLIAGYMFDITHTYFWAFLLMLSLYGIAIPAILAVRRPYTDVHSEN
jgi:MFS family permease